MIGDAEIEVTDRRAYPVDLELSCNPVNTLCGVTANMVEIFSWRQIAAFSVLLAMIGCGQAEPPAFHSNMPLMIENDIDDNYQQAITNVLGAMFGTPDEPYVMEETGLDVKKIKMSAGPTRSYQPGAKQGLYRQHCAHCHGVTGDGYGPTSQFLDPYPRDYRPAIYKFKSTYRAERPTHYDLHKTLINGVPGTAMPSFSLLPPDEVEALIEYVKYLSMRGQMEIELVDLIVNELEEDEETGEYHPLDPVKFDYQREGIEERLAMVAETWSAAEEQVVYPDESELPAEDRTPEELLASVVKGRELFYGTRANCIQCHGPTALGDGQQTDYNDWNKAIFQFDEQTRSIATQIEDEQAGMGKLSGDDYQAAKERIAELKSQYAEREKIVKSLFNPRNAIPRNLRQGLYRGGNRPIDLYWRFHQGIPGTPMPAVGPAAPGAQGTLTEEEIWNVVDYVRSLPFEPASQAQRQLPPNVEAVN